MLANIGLGELLWSLLVLFIMVQYFIVLFVVVVDVFRSDDLSGGKKALWLVLFLFFPLITLIAYLITRGDGIGMRNLARAEQSQKAAEEYIRQVAAPSANPASELQTAKSLLDSGAINQDEYDKLKARILG